jgi:hypothetical protein
MRGISAKAVLIGAAASIAIAALVGLLGVLLALITSFSLEDLAHPTPFREIPAVVVELTAVSALTLILAPIGAGYVAGRISSTHVFINAATAAGAWTFLMMLTALLVADGADQEPTMPLALNWLLSYGGPAFGLVGGHFANVRLLQLAALPIEQRTVFSLKSPLIATARWMLAFPIATVAYVIVLKVMVWIGAIILSSAAVTVSVLVGTAVAPSKQRRAAGIVFMVIPVLIPAEEVIRRALFGGLEHIQVYFLIINMIGAAMAYPFLHQIFPGIFNISQKWWWLAPTHYTDWTSDERNARRGLALTGSVVAIFLFVAVAKLLELIGVDAHYAAPFAAMIAVPLGFGAARPIYAELRPQEMRQADANAAMRLRQDQPI